MSTHPGPAAAGADLAQLALDFHHTHQLLDPAAQGVQWQVRRRPAPVGSLTAVRGLYWKSDNLRERMADEQSFPALVAAQLLDEDGRFTYEFEEFIESASSVLVVDRLHVEEAFADPVVVAGVVASVIDRLTDNYFAVVLPAKNACTDAGSALLAEAGMLLSAQEFSDELQIIDNALAAPEQAAQRVRSRLRLPRSPRPAGGVGRRRRNRRSSRTARRTSSPRGQVRCCGWRSRSCPSRSGRTSPMWGMRLLGAARAVSWARCRRSPFTRTSSGGGKWPAVSTTWPPNSPRRAPSARCAPAMALHLGIDRAKSLTRNRPRLVAETVRVSR
ncbi:hypothetical protein [Streptomyces sp. NL15-2K]|uniref:hypothetical protein n=1 Tax=Streptomyces sp. NL15-2K TaxID=376149 RepID=UPI0026EED99D|nr:hypothetical protein [Kutzneria buriramensis]WKX15982.1 hypothetical protein Q4V64_54300 [Kutzneria buriramensis]